MPFRLKQFAVTSTFIVAMATGVNADDQYDKCMNGAETNPDFEKCGGEWIDREDAKLNATWKKLRSAATDQTKEDLLAEQRLWIAFKEAACSFYANGEWGREGQVVHAPACKAEVIADRTDELEDYLEGISVE